MTELQILLREIKEIKSMLRQEVKVNNWVNGQTLTQLTLWDNSNKLKTARKNGYVTFKEKKGKGIVYNLNSIHPKIFKTP